MECWLCTILVHYPKVFKNHHTFSLAKNGVLDGDIQSVRSPSHAKPLMMSFNL